MFCSILKRPGWRMMDGCDFGRDFPCRKSPNPPTHQPTNPWVPILKIQGAKLFFLWGFLINIQQIHGQKNLPKGGLLYGIIQRMLQFNAIYRSKLHKNPCPHLPYNSKKILSFPDSPGYGDHWDHLNSAQLWKHQKTSIALPFGC